MTVKHSIWIGVLGGIGALCRWQFGLFMARFAGQTLFPWGTWCCNLLGCLFIGWLSTLPSSNVWRNRWMSGFAGAFTTFSAFSAETVQLLRDAHWWLALLYVCSSLALGWAMVVVGQVIGKNKIHKQSRLSS